jgi:hypothetical protein
MSLTDTRPAISPLVARTARAIYVASLVTKNPVPYDSLGHTEQHRYEDMARAALTEAYREPVVLS